MSMSRSRHAKTDSESSLAPSSPPRSPRRPVYYVQSPSHDGEKTANSFHSTPALSPVGSPGRHSRDSSSTRFSGSLKPGGGSRKQPDGPGRNGKGAEKEWMDEFGAIEEEGLLDDDGARGGIPRRWYVLAFVLAFFALFAFFSLVLWGASRNQKPVVTMKSITFNGFVIQAGNDASGVATEMVTMNSTVKFVFRNTGTFFGVHVASAPVDLFYYELSLASGNVVTQRITKNLRNIKALSGDYRATESIIAGVNNFYQSRKSQRTVTVTLLGNDIPLYGGGSDLGSKNNTPTAPVPLQLNFTVQARAYVLGKLVKPKFNKVVQCAVVMDPTKLYTAISFNKTSCTYQ
ncbi:hypothetical protein RHGRI_029483 [Rhododendron griersonianum]|uniref:Late embryogenesis abundant protein LEA-2 subgroup domain-containing protein n=1 Tax=Rhododendron griersonianum TaxID=479676 RepID=A0AAV6ILT8_9ERIC|nr:hypothetical protein RHGRI_029483 [Rhododendron griersonianum]